MSITLRSNSGMAPALTYKYYSNSCARGQVVTGSEEVHSFSATDEHELFTLTSGMAANRLRLISEGKAMSIRRSRKGNPGDLRLLQVLGFLVCELAIHDALVNTRERVEADDWTGYIARNPRERDLSMQAVRD